MICEGRVQWVKDLVGLCDENVGDVTRTSLEDCFYIWHSLFVADSGDHPPGQYFLAINKPTPRPTLRQEMLELPQRVSTEENDIITGFDTVRVFGTLPGQGLTDVPSAITYSSWL